MAENSYRAFAAISVSPEARAELAAFMYDVRLRLPKGTVRWVRAEQIHLTLKFFGKVNVPWIDQLTNTLRKAVEGQPAFTLGCAAPGCFPNGRAPRVLWVGLDGDLPMLQSLQQRVFMETSAWGSQEEKAFQPHLTLGRVSTTRSGELRQITDALQTTKPPQPITWRVSEVHLMQSVLAQAGARYTTLATISLSA